MSRRQVMRARHADGRIKRQPRSELLSPTESRRLLDLAKDGLRDPCWATSLGRLFIAGKLDASQHAAGRRWAALVAEYSKACQGPSVPRSMILDSPGAMAADPDSPAGRKEALRHEKAARDFLDGKHILHLLGASTEQTVEGICIADRALEGLDELTRLRSGLTTLSAHWSSKRKR